MKIVRHLGHTEADRRPRVVTLGNFDGVHLGHREIIRRASGYARTLGGTAVAVTFYPHPITVLSPDRAPLSLGGLRQRVRKLLEAGVDQVVVQHFTRRFSEITAESYVRDHLIGRLGMTELVVGHRVGFGHRRQGNAELLLRVGEELGFGVEIIPPVRVDGMLISSSEVRAAIASGNLAVAAAMLGGAYSVDGRVLEGHRRGRTLGFPTANLSLRGVQLPPDGVYAVRVVLADNSIHSGVANLGFNPTFGGQNRTLETHIFDFDGDLYRSRIEVRLVERLRGEIKFSGIDALRDQIRRDSEQARQVLGPPSATS